jgi:hypothetical protein
LIEAYPNKIISKDTPKEIENELDEECKNQEEL